MAKPICLRLLEQGHPPGGLAGHLHCSMTKATNTPIMAITTNNSTKVNARLPKREEKSVEQAGEGELSFGGVDI